MLPRLWLLVGSDQGTDRQCHLLSCPGQLKSDIRRTNTLRVDMWEWRWSMLGKVPASTLESLSNTINALTAFESSQFISDSSSCISFAEMNWFPSVSGNESLLFPFPNRRNGFFHSLPAPEFLSQFFTSFPFPTFGNVFFPCLFCSQTLKWNFPFPFPFAKF